MSSPREFHPQLRQGSLIPINHVDAGDKNGREHKAEYKRISNKSGRRGLSIAFEGTHLFYTDPPILSIFCLARMIGVSMGVH
jgi:hypothetical protein